MTAIVRSENHRERSGCAKIGIKGSAATITSPQGSDRNQSMSEVDDEHLHPAKAAETLLQNPPRLY